ncbi:MAG: radical SAM protein, partial [Clostridia bacterium]
MLCDNCPRHCAVDRSEKRGYCGQSDKLSLARAALHMWEEPIISGTRGSGAIFFAGCQLKCVFCQNFEVSRGKGKEISTHRLAEIFQELENAGAHNINLVTASHYVDQIIQAVNIYQPKIPLLFNCGGYESIDTIKKLDGIVDIFLPDFKFADNALAQRYCNAPDYFERCSDAILQMRKQVPRDIVVDGIMRQGMIIRHLQLPSALNNTLQFIEWCRLNLDKSTYISLMGQYFPCGQAANFPELNQKLKPLEYKIAIARLEKYGFDNSYVQ